MRVSFVAREPRRERWAWSAGCSVAAGATGALLMYFLDPDQGRRRRSMGRDRLAGSMRRGWRALTRRGRDVTADAYGLVQQATHVEPQHWSVPNDATLAHRIESELFRGSDIPKGRISINAEGGMIVLRGELDRPEQIRKIEDAVAAMPGVRGVHSLLHLPGTPVPDRGSVTPAP